MGISLSKLLENMAKNKKISLNSFDRAKITQLEREIRSRKITADAVVTKLQKEEKFRLDFEFQDWKRIKEEVEDMID